MCVRLFDFMSPRLVLGMTFILVVPMTMSCYEEIQAPTTAITLDQRNGVGGSTTGGGKGQQPPKSKQRRKFDSNIVGDYGGMEEWRDSNGNVALLGLMSPNLQNRSPLPCLLLVG